MNVQQLIIGTDQLAGVEARQQPDGSWLFNWVHAQNAKKGVKVLRHGAGVADARDLMKAIGPRLPIVLVLQHERAMLRRIDGNFDQERDLPKLLPNAQPGSLLVEVVEYGASSDVCIARLQNVQPVLDQLTGAGARITRLFIGPLVIAGLREMVDEGAFIGPYRIEADGPGPITVLRDVHRERAPLVLGDEHVEGACTLAFAACWQRWFAPLPMRMADLQLVNTAQREERFRLIYERGVLVLMFLLMTFLGVDLFLRHTMSSEQAGLQEQLQQHELRSATLATLQGSIALRKQLLVSSGASASADVLGIVDQVAASVPEGVQLSELWSSPTDGPVRKEEPFKRKDGLMVLAGSAQDASVLAGWVSFLGTLQGIKHARLAGLEQDKERGAPVFRIEIELA
ncbi:MAG: hypothetical protein ABI599_15220 [Flavobacteriales bacterium]